MNKRVKSALKSPGVKRERTVSQRHQSQSASRCVSLHGQVMHLQRTIGNQAVQRLLKAGLIQGKLTIGPANDVYEQEADRVADQMMRMSDETVEGRQSKVGGRKGKSLQMKPG